MEGILSADQFFSPTNIISVGVATGAVTFATNALCAVINKLPPKATAFVAGQVIAYLVVLIENGPLWYEWVLAFFNGCLLFCSATGANELGAAAAAQRGKGVAAPAPILKSWFAPRAAA
jgi:hypothetical protein